AEMRDKRRHYQAVIQAYYAQGSYYGESCAVSVFRLAEQLGRPVTLDLAWWAIVGTTSQFLLQQIDAEGYALVVKKMNETVRRISTTAPAEDTAPSSEQLRSEASMLDSQLDNAFNPHLESVPEEDDLAYQMALAGADNAAQLGKLTSSTHIAQRKAISESKELRFVLLRHWSLDSAMRFSPYVATRLGTWSSRGRSRFDLLLARLGLSKAEAREPYVHLDPELKKQLYRRIGQVGADYDMADATYSGFVRDYGWRKAPVSAADMVLAVLALLQCGPSELTEEASTTEGFYAAYDSLSQFPLLKRGIEHAQSLQRLIISQGVSMLERRSVKTLRTFRLAVLSDSDPVFSHPFALRQLALFLMQTLRERSKTAHARLPFVIAAPVPKTSEDADRLLVLGITPLDYSTDKERGSLYSGDSRNHFGMVFEEIAAEVKAEVRMGFFDSSALEIRRGDMSAFAERLRRHL
ncbi:DNA replication initiation factor cdc45, partial [Linderina pennispora]